MTTSVCRSSSSHGFTLMELLVVIAILALVITGSMMSYSGQLRKGFDGRRKTDLAKLASAFENYYNDKGVYPPPQFLTSCGGSQFEPWGIPKMLCDPESKQPYVYELVLGGGFRLYTELKDKTDPDIVRLGCGGLNGCGVHDQKNLNYGVSSGVPVNQN